ncbi:hypothetical protein C8T65DRAFT_741679 [Cerioporus squamosus]|nr:hypothetical protein C8T65DRAFT_741679 [Cerioporus squamosus]
MSAPPHSQTILTGSFQNPSSSQIQGQRPPYHQGILTGAFHTSKQIHGQHPPHRQAILTPAVRPSSRKQVQGQHPPHPQAILTRVVGPPLNRQHHDQHPPHPQTNLTAAFRPPSSKQFHAQRPSHLQAILASSSKQIQGQHVPHPHAILRTRDVSQHPIEGVLVLLHNSRLPRPGDVGYFLAGHVLVVDPLRFLPPPCALLTSDAVLDLFQFFDRWHKCASATTPAVRDSFLTSQEMIFVSDYRAASDEILDPEYHEQPFDPVGELLNYIMNTPMENEGVKIFPNQAIASVADLFALFNKMPIRVSEIHEGLRETIKPRIRFIKGTAVAAFEIACIRFERNSELAANAQQRIVTTYPSAKRVRRL